METAGYPVAFGHWQVQRRGVVCRLPQKMVTVRAPGALLRAVQQLCDGRLAWREVAAELAVRWSGAPVEAFLAELRGQGLLVDAGTEVATFADKPIDVPALQDCVRSAQQRLGAPGDWWVAVLRELPGPFGGMCPGLYRASVVGEVLLERSECHPEKAWHLLRDPRILTFASAVLAPVDVDAGDLATAGDWHATAGVACAIRQDLDAGAAQALFGRTALCIAVGAAATAVDAANARAAKAIALCPAPSAVSVLPQGFAFVAGPVPSGHGDIFTTGRSNDPRIATRKAEAEAWERKGWAQLQAGVLAPMATVAGAVDPRRVVAYAEQQHARPDFPFTAFREDAAYLWRTGCDVATAAPVALPAECVHALSALPPRLQRTACTSTSTSGMAAWTDVEGALCRATLELVERDSFLRCWVAQRSLPTVARESLPAWAVRRLEELEGRGLRVEVLQVQTELACVFAVFTQGRCRPFTAVTAAAEFHPESALMRALDEADGRAAHAAAFPATPMQAGEAVRTPADINRVYQSPSRYREADFLVGDRPACRFGTGSDAAGSWSELQARLARTGHRIYAFDLTPTGAAIDQGRVPLHVVRAVVPGLLPIWFGNDC